MAYKTIDVDGTTYEYTVGKTHLKIKGFNAIGVNVGLRGDEKNPITPQFVADTIRSLVAG